MRRQIFLSLFLIVALCAASACNTAQPNAANRVDKPGVTPPFAQNARPIADAEYAVITTSYGTITMELYSNIAPLMVARFKELAREGFYNGTTFHRVDAGLGIIQGGDPNTKDDDPRNDGAGDSPKPDVTAEFTDVRYTAGIVGAARQSGWDTANCQFFITIKDQPSFDKRYTVFGKVTEGLNNARVIAGAPQNPSIPTRPDPPVLIQNVEIRSR